MANFFKEKEKEFLKAAGVLGYCLIFVGGETQKLKKMKDLTREEFKEQVKNDPDAVILDVRTQEEVDEGIIPNAKNLDIYKGQEFVDELEKLDKSKNYYVYCRSGKRSVQAATLMDSLGFNKTYNLLGGFSEWDGEVEH